MTHEEAMQDDFQVPNNVKLENKPSVEGIEKARSIFRERFKSDLVRSYEEPIIAAMQEYASLRDERIKELEEALQSVIEDGGFDWLHSETRNKINLLIKKWRLGRCGFICEG